MKGDFTLKQKKVKEIYLQSKDQIFIVNEDNPLADDYRVMTGFEEIFEFFDEGGRADKVRVYILNDKLNINPREVITIIYNYCDDKIKELELERRERNNEVWRTMISSLIILASFTFLSHLVEAMEFFNEVLTDFISEALFIVGWVSLWHPIELLLYDNWYERSDIDTYRRIKDLEIEIRCS